MAALWTGTGCGTNTNAMLLNGNCSTPSSGGPVFCQDASGSGTTYTCPGAILGSLVTGTTIIFIPQTNSSGNFTINVAGTGAIAAYYNDGNRIGAGGAQAGVPYIFTYNSAGFLAPYARIVAGATNCLTANFTVNPPTIDINSSCVATQTGSNTMTGSSDYSGASNVILPQVTEVVGTVIASASTITPIAPITHINGTAAIATITAPTNFAASNRGGCIVLIADAAWTTTTAGNIATAITAVASQQYSFCYDNGTTKWYLPPPGGSTGTSGTLFAGTAAPQTGSGAYQTLATHTFEANTFSVGDTLDFYAAFLKTGTAAGCTFSISFGNSLGGSTGNNGGATSSGDGWLNIQAHIFVSGASAQSISGRVDNQTGYPGDINTFVNATSAISGTITIAVIQICTSPDTGAVNQWYIARH